MNFATAIGDYTKEQLVQLLIHQQAMNAKLTHELAILKRQKFAATSEAYAGEQQRGLCRNKVERTKNVARVRKIKKLNYKTVQLWTKADLWRQVSFAFSESYAWFQYPQ